MLAAERQGRRLDVRRHLSADVPRLRLHVHIECEPIWSDHSPSG